MPHYPRLSRGSKHRQELLPLATDDAHRSRDRRRRRLEVIEGTFSVLEEIGRGAFGTVYKCRQLATNTLCAVKSVPRVHHGVSVSEMIMTEIAVMQKLDHPNIIKLISPVLATSSNLFLPMELCVCELLDVIDQEAPLSEEDVLKVMKPVLHALAFVHKNNILHRDLKPQNILLASDDLSDVRITDFGLSAMLLGASESLNERCGSPAYMAPEVIDSHLVYDEKCDVWSAGVIMFYMLAGRRPFPSSYPEVFMEIKLGVYKFPSDVTVSRGARHLVGHLLQVVPTHRYTAALALEHPWIMGDPEAVPPQTVSEMRHSMRVEDLWKKLLRSVLEFISLGGDEFLPNDGRRPPSSLPSSESEDADGTRTPGSDGAGADAFDGLNPAFVSHDTPHASALRKRRSSQPVVMASIGAIPGQVYRSRAQRRSEDGGTATSSRASDMSMRSGTVPGYMQSTHASSNRRVSDVRHSRTRSGHSKRPRRSASLPALKEITLTEMGIPSERKRGPQPTRKGLMRDSVSPRSVCQGERQKKRRPRLGPIKPFAIEDGHAMPSISSAPTSGPPNFDYSTDYEWVDHDPRSPRESVPGARPHTPHAQTERLEDRLERRDVRPRPGDPGALRGLSLMPRAHVEHGGGEGPHGD